MIIMRRPLRGHGKTWRTPVEITAAFHGPPSIAPHSAGPGAAMATMSGPSYKGMDPSDPVTWTRMWNPQPGMISYLNFDGARMQGTTPTQIQRGPQSRPRKLRMGFG